MSACPVCEAEIAEGAQVCPHCGSDVVAARAVVSELPRPGGTRWISLAITILIIGGVFVVLALPSISSRRPAPRAESINNLRNIALATLNTASARKRYPPGNADGAPRHPGYGWAVEILPNMEAGNLYREFDFTKPWDDPANARLLAVDMFLYRNPAIRETQDARGYWLIHYAGNVRLLGRTPALAPADVTDGAGSTLMIGEINAGFRPWGDPDNLRDPAAGLDGGPHQFGGPWKDGVTVFAFADGSVRIVADDIAPHVLEAIATPDGGETVDFPK
ncbi:MAG: DUF1559 domain-containing protein [Planctomycetaceae bacterium]